MDARRAGCQVLPLLLLLLAPVLASKRLGRNFDSLLRWQVPDAALPEHEGRNFNGNSDDFVVDDVTGAYYNLLSEKEHVINMYVDELGGPVMLVKSVTVQYRNDVQLYVGTVPKGNETDANTTDSGLLYVEANGDVVETQETYSLTRRLAKGVSVTYMCTLTHTVEQVRVSTPALTMYISRPDSMQYLNVSVDLAIGAVGRMQGLIATAALNKALPGAASAACSGGGSGGGARGTGLMEQVAEALAGGRALTLPPVLPGGGSYDDYEVVGPFDSSLVDSAELPQLDPCAPSVRLEAVPGVAPAHLGTDMQLLHLLVGGGGDGSSQAYDD